MMNRFIKNNNHNKPYHIISMNAPDSAIAEQYRKLHTNIDYSSFNKELKIINLTSSFPGEGKTVTVLNLAVVYSQANQKTLIIDMDLRKPKIHRAFNLSNTQGLTSVAIHGKDKSSVIQQISENLHVLPAGDKMPFPVEFLTSKQLQNVITELKGEYDKIIIDCPPMTAVTDASVISKLTDGTILIVTSRKTNEDVAKAVLKTLKDNGANVIGSVLTKVHRKDQKYISGYYYNNYTDE